MLTRRLALVGAASALAGCGFHPLYGPVGAVSGSVGGELQAIYVAVMGERDGQLLRQALQRRFAGTDESVHKKYELTGGLGISGEAIAIQRDSSSTRTRLIGTGTYVLRELNQAATVLKTGSVKVIDGVNINDQQYFASELEQEVAHRRIAESAADQITIQVAAFLRQRLEKPA